MSKDLGSRGLVSVGSSDAPDLETIAALHPDLIVGDSGNGTADVKQLEDIAPVADINSVSVPFGAKIANLYWYPELRLMAQVLDREAQFNSFISKFQAAAAAVGRSCPA